MPNIRTYRLNDLVFPVEIQGFCFNYEALSEKKMQKLINVTYKDREFFLQIIKRDKDYLIKGDKLSRVSPVSILQNALRAFVRASHIEPFFSNIEPKKKKTIKFSPYLKDISYFFNEFKTDKEIWVEVGFGSGRHLLYQAKRHSEVQFVGIEIHKPSIEQVLKQIELQGLTNLLILDYDARILLEFLPSNSVGKIFVHFPVPWDKKPHRRVISKDFIEESIRVLKKDAALEIRTDSDNYFKYSFDLFMQLSKNRLEIKKNEAPQISSKYEDRWRRKNKNIYDIKFINYEESYPKNFEGELIIEENADFAKVKKKFENKIYKGEGYFVHFEEIFSINANNGVIRLSFGANERSEHKYLIFKDNKVAYFPNPTLPSYQNIKAHQKIKEWIYG